MIDFEHKVTDLEVDVGSEHGAQLRRRSQFEFEYLPTPTRQASLLMPLEDRLFRDGELFAAMDMNLPEGFLLAQLREDGDSRAAQATNRLNEMGDRRHVGDWVWWLRGNKPPWNFDVSAEVGFKSVRCRSAHG